MHIFSCISKRGGGAIPQKNAEFYIKEIRNVAQNRDEASPSTPKSATAFFRLYNVTKNLLKKIASVPVISILIGET